MYFGKLWNVYIENVKICYLEDYDICILEDYKKL